MTQNNQAKSGSRLDAMRIRIIDKFFPDKAHQRSYNSFLHYQHRSFDVKGLTTQGVYTLELEQVFVDLALAPQRQQQRVSADPIRPMPKQLRGGRNGLWAYLTSGGMASENIVILGPPGSGKTTLLKHMALSLAADSSPSVSDSKLNKIPILLFLRDHASEIAQNPQFSLIDAVQDRLKIWDVEIPSSWFMSGFKRGQCLVMLDGLDEVADPDLRRHVVAWVERQTKIYANNRFVITSRPFGYYHNPLKNVTRLEVRPFTIDQVRKFVHNWYLANEMMSAQRDDPGVRMDAKRGAEDLLWRLRQVPVLLDMAVNPLLLTMIATVHRYRSSLPGRRVELYAEICEVFLGKRQAARGITFDLTPAQKQRVLQALAYYMMHHQQREIEISEAAFVIERPLQRVIGAQHGADVNTGEAFLKMIENSSGLLVEREVGVYSFAHLTFQEYLAAAHVLDQKLESELTTWVDDSWWHETIRLYAAQADATNIIKACLARKLPSVPALTLAMECLEEAREVRPELRTIFDRLARSVDHKSPEVRQIASEVFLALRLRRMVRINERKYVDTSLITHAEYQLFLNETRLKHQYFQPDHWRVYQYPSGKGRVPIVGVRPLDGKTFCQWLTDRESGGWQYRLPRADELKLGAISNDSHIENAAGAGHWFVKDSVYRIAPFELESNDFEYAQIIQYRFEYDWDLYDPNRHNAIFEHMKKLIGARAKKRQFSLLDLGRDLSNSLRDYSQLLDDLNQIKDRSGRDIASDLDMALDLAIGIVNNPDLSAARNVNLDGVADLANSLHHDLNKKSELKLPRGITQEIQRSITYAESLAGNREVVMFQELDRALNNALRLTRELSSIVDKAYVKARTRIRANALASVAELLVERERRKASGIIQAGEGSKQLIGSLIDLYLDMAILEERIARKLPAFEGLRIIKERP
ncbi:MAG: NACHT domain-containing protein [Chloroflexi bacterium]|nr:NACHT domain-containing protein [Chloroflexota bacterium]